MESIDWYRLYGVSMKPVPPDWDAFQQYWEHMINNVLEDSRPVREGFHMYRTMPPPTSKRLSDRANTVVGPLILKPLVQTPLVKLILWVTTGALPPVIRERLCLDWTGLDELRYRLHLKAVHAMIKGIPTHFQYFPLARDQRAHYHRTGTVAPIPLPTRNRINQIARRLRRPDRGERLQGSEQDRKGRSNGEVCIWRSGFGAMSLSRTLRQKFPFLRYSFLRGAFGGRNVIRTGQMGDGREEATAEYVIANAPAGDVDAAIDAIDNFAYDKSILMNVGDEKGQLLDAAVKRANPKLAMELGAYCGYSGLRIARAAPGANVFSIEKSGANASVARRVWAHAGLGDRITCINGTVGDGTTLEVLAKDYGFTEGCLDFVFLDHWKDVYLDRPAAASRPGLAASGDDRGRRQRRHPRRTQVPLLHEGTARQAVADHRARNPRRVSDATQRPGSGVGVPGLKYRGVKGLLWTQN